MDLVKIQCCLCGSLTTYNSSKMCVNCLQSRVSLTDDIAKEQTLQICRYCDRYNKPPWLPAKLESKELLIICLSRIKNIQKIKVADSGFLYTEPHSRRLMVKIKVQKEVEGVLMEQECIVTFVINDTQCDECKKSFTPHTWTAKVQLRQKASHMKTLHHLEQQIIEANVNKEFKAVKQKENGLDVQFVDKSAAKRFVDFVVSKVPAQVKYSKQLISADLKSNIYNNKHTFAVDIPEVCKDDIVILPYGCRIPGVGQLLLCTKVTSQIHLMDIFTFQHTEVKPSLYWKSPFHSHASKERLKQFVILDIEETKDGRFDVEVTREDEERFGERSFRIWSHFGKGLNCGDIVLGYDMASMVNHQWHDTLIEEAPDVILIKSAKTGKKEKKKKLTEENRENKVN